MIEYCLEPANANKTRIGGIVLCGGRSKRMGRPKAWLPIGAELLLPRVVRLLSEVVAPIVVVAALGQELPELSDGVQIVRDEEDDRGPLQGLAAGLAALSGKADAAYASSCDAPFLRPAFVRRIIELLGPNQICVPRVGDYHHPLAAVYRLDVLPAVRSLLVSGHRRPIDLFASVATRVIGEFELRDVDAGFESLRNVNTPEEYAQALRELEG